MSSKALISDLKKLGTPERAQLSQRYFKTGEGEYGQGDVFIGVSMPNCRKLAKDYSLLTRKDVKTLLQSKIHEVRMVGLLILSHQYEAAKKRKDEKACESVYSFYCKNFKSINNWDLVDVSAPYVVGKHLIDKDRKIIYKWAKSKDLWTRRISVICQWWWIRKGDTKDIYKMAPGLFADSEDLMHKAVGWMLREAGKHDMKKLKRFLEQHYEKLPRTLLRYSIEKFPEKTRKAILKGQF